MLFAQDVGHGLKKEMIGMMSTSPSALKKPPVPEEKKQVVLTPEEQELVKSIDAKAGKTAFRANIRLLASAATQEPAEEILGHLENAFGQFENPEVNSFRC